MDELVAGIDVECRDGGSFSCREVVVISLYDMFPFGQSGDAQLQLIAVFHIDTVADELCQRVLYACLVVAGVQRSLVIAFHRHDDPHTSGELQGVGFFTVDFPRCEFHFVHFCHAASCHVAVNPVRRLSILYRGGTSRFADYKCAAQQQMSGFPFIRFHRWIF